MKRRNPFSGNDALHKKVHMSIDKDENGEPEVSATKDPGAPDNEDDLTEVVVLLQDQLQEPTEKYAWDRSIANASWSDQYAAIQLFRETIKFHADYIQNDFPDLEPCLSNLVVPCAVHLRSAHARQSIYCIGEVVQCLGDAMSSHLSIFLPILVTRAVNEKKFIRGAAHDALSHTIASCNPITVLDILMTFSTDKNPQIVAAAGDLIERVISQNRVEESNQSSPWQDHLDGWIDPLAKFLVCRVVSCKSATKRSFHRLRDLVGADTLTAIASRHLAGSNLVDVLALISSTRPNSSSGMKPASRPSVSSLRARMLRQQQQQQEQQKQKTTETD
ncbi:hypothetical protein LEN26_020165 [Aphanomyces euteiches]|nr:hypothetical protein LEN26_020165 [Aphanomyces euteiches]